MVRIWSPTEGARKIESWGPGITRLGRRQSSGESAESQRFQGGLKQGGPRVLVLYQEGCPAVFQDDCGTIPGNSQGCITGYKFPRRRQRRYWRPGIIPEAGIGVVLEAWCYTRAAGTEVVHVAVTGFQGIPDCVARYKLPRQWR